MRTGNGKGAGNKTGGVKAVVVLSGGQDSALCLALAVRRFGADAVAAITFAYGQRHAVETKYARRLAKRFCVRRHKVVRLGFFGELTTNALLDHGAKICRRKGAKCPTTVVEGRNAVFLQLAAFFKVAISSLYASLSFCNAFSVSIFASYKSIFL